MLIMENQRKRNMENEMDAGVKGDFRDSVM